MPPVALVLPACLLAVATAGDREIYEAAVARVESSYLHVDRVDPVLAWRLAAISLEEAIPWLLVDLRDRNGMVEAVLSHGDHGPFATLGFPVGGRDASQATTTDLVAGLELLEDAVQGQVLAGRASLPEGVDLPVELLRGASRALDRHSVILAGDRLDRFNERLRGRLVGIGSRIEVEGNELVVRQLFEDSPAQKGGLLPGDVLLRLDGVSTRGMTLDDAVERIRGEKGSVLLVELRRPGHVEPLRLSLVRDEVRIPNVEWSRTQAGMGWIRIDHFSQQTVRLMETALQELSQAPGVQGLVLDLRGNTGGSMLQAAKTVDLFVDDGLILRTGGRGFERVDGLVREVQAWPADPESPVPSLALQAPLAVLIDRESASASEIVAGALALLDRAVLLGEASHGKGTVQQPFVLRPEEDPLGEVKLKLTIAEYQLARETRVEEGLGIRPDVATEPVVLSASGADLPVLVGQGQALGFVVETQSWSGAQATGDRGDLLLGLAEEILAGTDGSARTTALASAARTLARARQREETRLEEAMQRRGVDWSPDDLCTAPCGLPRVAVELSTLSPARAGAPVPVQVVVHNLGPAPLHRVLVRLTATSSRVPWSGLALPVGFVPPEEQARAVVLVDVPMFEAARQDLVSVVVEADRRPSVGVEPVLMSIQGEALPRVRAELVGMRLGGRPAPDLALPLQVMVRLKNESTATLTGVQLRFLHPDDARLDPIDQERVIPQLLPGQEIPVAMAFAWNGPDDQPPPARLHLEVGAERYGDLLEAPVDLGWEMTPVLVLPPRLSGQVPLTASSGDLAVRVRASDERRVRQVMAWWDGNKIAWRSGRGPSLDLDLDLFLAMDESTHTLMVEVEDEAGVKSRRRWYVRSMHADDGISAP